MNIWKKLLSIVCLLSAISAFSAKLLTEKEIDELVSLMTFEEKARMLVGFSGSNDEISHKTDGAAGWTFPINRLGIPSINLADGPVGIRINPVSSEKSAIMYDSSGIPLHVGGSENESEINSKYCTCFPSTTALAATWNSDAAYMQGTVMGDEARCYGIDVILTPGINIMRNPLCGRNFEYYSEDPVLTGKLAAAMIRGIQEKGIGTSLKHFVANNQQTGKKYNDARISQRALREIYLKGFEICVKEAKPWTVMGSYNKIAGEFTQTNKDLMLRLLRDEWGFKGLVLTDWTVRRPTVDLLNARCALMMPGEEEIVAEIMDAIRSGAVCESTLDACVKDVLGLVAKSISAKGWKPLKPNPEKHAAISRDIAVEGIVLLKNELRTLPLAQNTKVALFGATAYHSIAGGTGSSNVNKSHIIDIVDGLERAGFNINKNIASVYEKYSSEYNDSIHQNKAYPNWQKLSYQRVVLPELDLTKRKDWVDTELAQSDVAVVVIGRGSGETSDRSVHNDFNISFIEQNMLRIVKESCQRHNKKMVVVMNVCGMMETASWKDLPDAILMSWFPGQECGDVIADIISGKANPSGRLPMTLPLTYGSIPSSRNYPFIGQTHGRNFDYTDYEEDIWVGYRYFDTAKKKISYPFGYGLSYTEFEYSSPKIKKNGDRWEVSITVKNIGAVAGKDVLQIYVKAPNGHIRKPESELKAFAKTKLLYAGESETVSMSFSDYDIASFDERNSKWVADSGNYVVKIGKSVEETIATLKFNLERRLEWKVENLLAPVKPVKVMDIDNEKPHYDTFSIRDLVLIYQGGANRIDWTENQFLPYVSHSFSDGKRDWLFDGFLFLDQYDGRGSSFIPAWGVKKARKIEWKWYLDRLFEKNKSLDALDNCISRLKQSIGNPGFKHKIVLSIPTPLPGQTDWGEVDGRSLDFNNYEDQAAAAKWYINEIVARFKSCEFENLELVGLYWIDEDICHTKELTKFIAPIVHEKGLQFVWIPYYKARGYDRWQELGFDIAYHQPNYFFHKNIPYSQLDESCELAREHGMAMEFEIDSKALIEAEDSSFDRMQSYIDAFKKNGVFEKSAIAYYTGSKALIDMANSARKENHLLMDQLARIIIDRRKNNMIIKRTGDTIRINSVLQNSHEIKYEFSNCMANNLYTFSKVEIDSSVVNWAISDNIGPFLVKGKGWTGGNHLLPDGRRSAKTVSVEAFADGKRMNDDVCISARKIDIFVVNHLLNPGNTEQLLCVENVHYIICGNSIQVDVCHEFLNKKKIDDRPLLWNAVYDGRGDGNPYSRR